MRALTVQQPWATAIVHWGKSPENRSRNIAGARRGPLAIHAGLREDEEAYDDDMIREALGTYDDSWRLFDQLETRGAIIGVVDLVAVHQSPRRVHAQGETPPMPFPDVILRHLDTSQESA